MLRLLLQLQGADPLLQGFRLRDGCIKGLTGGLEAELGGWKAFLQCLKLRLRRAEALLQLLQALGCLLSALQHRLPLAELLLPAR